MILISEAPTTIGDASTIPDNEHSDYDYMNSDQEEEPPDLEARTALVEKCLQIREEQSARWKKL